MANKKFYAQKDALGYPIPGTMMSAAPEVPEGNIEIPAENVISDIKHPDGLRYFVRRKGNGDIIPNSLIVSYDTPVGPVYEFKLASAAPAPPPPPALVMTFTSGFPVPDAADLSLWNSLFSATFTSVSVSGMTVRLEGVTSFTLGYQLLSSTLSLIDDQNGCITGAGQYAFAANPALKTVKLPALLSITGAYNFMGSGSDVNDIILYLPLCTSFGTNVNDNLIFSSSGFEAKNITLTVPASVMTAKAGGPEGDVKYLIDNNTVSVVTV